MDQVGNVCRCDCHITYLGRPPENQHCYCKCGTGKKLEAKTMNNYSVTLPKEGWKCPVCSAVMSPTYPTCFYCKPSQSQSIPGITDGIGITGQLPACDHDWDFTKVLASNPPKYQCKKCRAYSVFENKAML